MNNSRPQDAAERGTPPAEHPAPSASNAELPSTRYRATLRLIGFRQVDENRSKPKRWWFWKR